MEDLDVHILEVTDLARGGAGVARDASGRVIFVPKTAPGDRIRAKILRVEKKYAQGELLEVLQPSPMRQEARCPAFGRCGGCAWQHIPYSFQWQTKVSGVRHALSRVQLEIPSNFEEFPAERIWEYRNRVQLRGSGDKIGFHAAGSRELVPVQRCDIARPEINAAWDALRAEGGRLAKPFKVEVSFSSETGLRVAWNARHGAIGFRQVHDDQNEELRQWIASYITRGRVLYDLFGGSGNLSAGIALAMTHVHCVDVLTSQEAPQGLAGRFSFHRADVSRWISRFEPKERSASASAILDPPRIGLADHFAAIEDGLRRLDVTEVIAVGCDPDAWARDVCRFSRRGWRLMRVALFDFFPQTPHIESVALLERC